MAEHAWILEHLESYLAGGLAPDERGRLETHIAGCEPCARALDEARKLDRSLDGLFMPVRPSAEMEDRMIRALRERPLRRWPRAFWLAPAAAGLAALLVVGIVGSWMLHVISQGDLPFFNASRELR